MSDIAPKVPLSTRELLLVVLPVILFADLFFCAVAFPRSMHTAYLGRVLWPFGGSYVKYAVPRASALNDGGTIRVVLDGSDAGSALRNDPDAQRDVIATVRCFPWPRTTGLFGPVIERYGLEIEIDQANPPLTVADEAAVRAAYLDTLDRDWVARKAIWPGYVSKARASDGTAMRVRPIWLLHDAVMLGLLIFLITGLTRWAITVLSPPARAARRTQRASAALALDRCPSCGYSIAGMTQGKGHRCPECGRELVP